MSWLPALTEEECGAGPFLRRRREPFAPRHSLMRKTLPEHVERLLLETSHGNRFTQDSPIMPDVWLAFAERIDRRVDLLITPHWTTPAGELARVLREHLTTEGKAHEGKAQQDDGREEWREWVRREAGGDAGTKGSRAPGLPGIARVAYNDSTVAAALRFDELVRVVLPMTEWWTEFVWTERVKKKFGKVANALASEGVEARLVHDLVELGAPLPEELKELAVPPDLLWMVRLVGVLALAALGEEEALEDFLEPDARSAAAGEEELSPLERRRRAARVLIRRTRWLVTGMDDAFEPNLVHSVSRNRRAEISISASALAVKADAARRLFDLSCAELTWAIIDSGVDATHPAFALRGADGTLAALEAPKGNPFRWKSRIKQTYDFSLVRYLLAPDGAALDARRVEVSRALEAAQKAGGGGDEAVLARELAILDGLRERLDGAAAEVGAQELRRGLNSGRSIDWGLLSELLEIPHDEGYRVPEHDHGTHVAGILAGDWRPNDGDAGAESPGREALVGVCPDIRLIDLRVLGADGTGDEFAVIAALQFVRYLNAHKDYVVVHGANLSLSIRHEVVNYACGRTPVCEESGRLVSAGVVVVAAAGNRGYLKYQTAEGLSEGYHSISITDPGNAEQVITVGATHRSQPHTYGVSYFSSRGPTGDGRAKPDLVAPGEKIVSATPGGKYARLDGTSMAAPHVSGAAALLIARHRELAKDPARVKQILCGTATDLGRERYFQGAGMLDVLRALQSV